MKIIGARKVKQNIHKIDASLLKQLDRAVEWTARGVQAKAKQNITAGGIPYIPLKPATIKAKKSSKPLIDTGLMRKSIEVEHREKLIAYTYAGTEYAAIHEFGAPQKNIPKRAFMIPAMNQEKAEMAKKFKNKLNVTFRR